MLVNNTHSVTHTHTQGRLPLSSELLGECAMNCRAYAKALHYKEEELHRGPSAKTLEAFISINNKLQQPDAAAGVLVFAQKHLQGDFVSATAVFLHVCNKLSKFSRAVLCEIFKAICSFVLELSLLPTCTTLRCSGNTETNLACCTLTC